MKRFQKINDGLFTTIEADQMKQVSGGLFASQPTETLPTITITPTKNQTDGSGSSHNDGNDGPSLH
jgi:hypothetical protein